MFKFLFRRKQEVPEIVKETQRETVTRALEEIYEIVAAMEPRPKITIDVSTGLLSLDLPEQMPDEALALPSPSSSSDDASAAPSARVDSPDRADDGKAGTTEDAAASGDGDGSPAGPESDSASKAGDTSRAA